MNTFTARQPRGLPVGGQFAPQIRAEDFLDLSGTVTTPDLDFSFPFPQANNLHKVACVVDAVAAGANTGESVAETLELSDREGFYYADAAGYLGFVTTIDGAGAKTYELTPWGEQLLAEDAAGRAELLKATAYTVPAVQIFSDRGEAGVLEYLEEETGLGETTAIRRTATISAWRNAVAHTDEFTQDVEAERLGAGLRSEAAALNAVRERMAREARVLAASQEKKLATCDICGMGLPLSAVCDNC